MKFICSQSDLSANLSLVSRSVPARPSHPVLANVLMSASAEKQQVSLVGFDLSLGIQTSFSAQVETAGTLTLPAKLLNDIVSRLPPGDVTLDDEAGESLATLTCASGRYQVHGMGADDFPELPLVEAGQAAALPAEVLLAGLRGSLFATSADETKQVLTGVHLSVDQDTLEFAATDGHRLAVVQTFEPSSAEAASITMLDDAMNVTIPAKALRELERMVQMYKSSEAIALRFDQGQVIFELGDQRVTSRLLEGQYPNYPQLIPEQFANQVTIERRLLISALERIAVLADQKNNIVKLTLDCNEQTLHLSVEAQDVGSGQETIVAQISGDSMDIAFNVKYLLDGLKVIDNAEVQLQFNTPTSPAVVTPLGGVKMTYLIMPVQIRS
ncbi:MAG: DNA polymerase III subunit beta [Cyanothece sp. SIO1E1]|nr:DNA polymerase III subunit beta [Cyanothece sp. SIO1E1]